MSQGRSLDYDKMHQRVPETSALIHQCTLFKNTCDDKMRYSRNSNEKRDENYMVDSESKFVCWMSDCCRMSYRVKFMLVHTNQVFAWYQLIWSCGRYSSMNASVWRFEAASWYIFDPSTQMHYLRQCNKPVMLQL